LINTVDVAGAVELNYVGLPLAVEFGRAELTVASDLPEERIDHCRKINDPTNEVSEESLHTSTYLKVTTDVSALVGYSPERMNPVPTLKQLNCGYIQSNS
jgi:UDP-N-acetyl-D-mannosaminuronate dehydrogenase